MYLFCQIFYLPKAKLFKNKLENSITNWQLKSTGLIDNAPDQAFTTLQKSINKGIYKIPEKYLKK